jgi:hypothetical protein
VKKHPAKKKSAKTKAVPKVRSAIQKRTSKPATRNTAPTRQKVQAKKRSKSEESIRPAFAGRARRAHSGEQSGDLQGLSHRAGADSESVDELLEEGNAFEAGVVGGVEEAGDEEETEVHTHEVSEDDVPTEYLDQDN